MSDRFSQEVRLKLPTPLNGWRVAKEVEAMVEAAWGDLWRTLSLDRSARTRSEITFYADSLAELQAEVEQHGAPLASIDIWTTYASAPSFMQCRVHIWPSGSETLTDGAMLEITGFNRVDVEAFMYSLRRSTEILAKKKTTLGAQFVVGPSRTSSVANRERTAPAKPMIRARGLRPKLWRKFIMHRNEVAASLLVGLAGSLIFNGLQLAGIVAVPR